MSKSKGFMIGFGSVISLFPSRTDVQTTIPAHSDAEAFQKDMQAVGNDIYHALYTVDSMLNKKKESCKD